VIKHIQQLRSILLGSGLQLAGVMEKVDSGRCLLLIVLYDMAGRRYVLETDDFSFGTMNRWANDLVSNQPY